MTQDAISHLIKFSGGDARTLINALEMAIETTAENDAKEIKINLSIAEDAIQKKNIVYDKNGQNHYDIISAFIKSIRGSDQMQLYFGLRICLRLVKILILFLEDYLYLPVKILE